MKECKVYKGLQMPCLIKGLIANDFYIVLAMAIIGGAYISLSVNTLVQTWDIVGFLTDLIIVFSVLVGMYTFFRKRVKRSKRKIDKRVLTISNRSLYNTLIKRNIHGK